MSLYVFQGARLLHDQVLILDGEFLEVRALRKGHKSSSFSAAHSSSDLKSSSIIAFLVFQKFHDWCRQVRTLRVCVVGPTGGS